MMLDTNPYVEVASTARGCIRFRDNGRAEINGYIRFRCKWVKGGLFSLPRSVLIGRKPGDFQCLNARQSMNLLMFAKSSKQQSLILHGSDCERVRARDEPLFSFCDAHDAARITNADYLPACVFTVDVVVCVVIIYRRCRLRRRRRI